MGTISLCWAALVHPVTAQVTNPFETLDEILIAVVLILLLFVLIKYHRRIIFLLTGEEYIRIQIGDAFWVAFCRCGGMCDGEWTRWLSHACCCCHKELRGTNLLRGLGQMLGVVAIPLCVSNIVAGDLPTFSECGDFYVSVEVGSDPHQITSVAEDYNPKVVHFPETLTLRIKVHPLESNVRIVVKELKTFGSRELCECYINPMVLMKWRISQHGPMRFRMEPLERYSADAFTFPPWILLEISPQPEWNPGSGARIRVMDTVSKEPREFTPRGFKSTYTLLNTYGRNVPEPDEEKVGVLDRTKRRRNTWSSYLLFMLGTVSVLYWVPRMYCHHCYHGYFKIQVLKNNHLAFPVSPENEDFFEQQCGLAENPTLSLLSDIALSGMNFAMRVSGQGNGTELNRTSLAAALSHVASSADPSKAAGEGSGGGRLLRARQGSEAGKRGTTTTTTRGPLTLQVGTPDASGIWGLPTRAGLSTEDVASGARDATASAKEHGQRLAEGARAARAAAHAAAADLAAQHLAVSGLAGPAPGVVSDEKAMRRCRPDFDEVEQTCKELPFGAAPPGVALSLFSIASVSIPCVPPACKLTRILQDFDLPYLVFLAVWVVSFVSVRSALDLRITLLHKRVHGGVAEMAQR